MSNQEYNLGLSPWGGGGGGGGGAEGIYPILFHPTHVYLYILMLCNRES